MTTLDVGLATLRSAAGHVAAAWDWWGRLVRSVMPTGLYARSLLIIVTPMVLLQSVVEQARTGQLAHPLAAQSWTRLGDHTVAHPAAPALYPLEPGGNKYYWQLTADEAPQPGRLCTINAVISWAEHDRHKQVSLSTQLYLP